MPADAASGVRRWSVLSRAALAVVLLAAIARAQPASTPPPLDVTAELDWQSTYLHSTDGSLSASGPRLELSVEHRPTWWFGFGGFAALTHVPGDLGSNGYHIDITGGEYSVFGGGRLWGWFGRHVFAALGLGTVTILSGGHAQTSGLVEGEVGVEPLAIGHWAGRLVAGYDLYVFDAWSNTAWLGAALVYR